MPENPPPDQPQGWGQPPPGQPYGPPPAYGPPDQPAYAAPYGQPGFGAPPEAGPSKRWYQRWWVWLIIVIVLVVIGGIVYGLNHTSGNQLESKIKDTAKKNNIDVTSVKCPSSINTDKGHVYTCTAKVNGTPTTLKVDFIADKKFTVSQVP